MPKTKEVARDTRDFDTTQLHEAGHGRTLHRDFIAHAWRWAFARRFITAKDHVLEVGCGQDKPLSKILCGGAAAGVDHYTGVDLNKLKPSNSQRLTFHGEFNFVDRYKELLKARPQGYDVLVTMEVIEHMHSKHQLPFLKACFACLRPGGHMLLSTPAYDGKRMAANHIAEITVPELQALITKAKFEVVRRHGTFTDIKWIGKAESKWASKAAILEVRKGLENYFDSNFISNIFGPLYEDQARNCLWVTRKPE